MLAARAARGDADAQTALIARLQPLLAGVGRRFRGMAPEPDLLQSGTLGLLLALPGYDPERGPFEPYAMPFVVGEMASCARESMSGVRLPRGVRADGRRVEEAMEALTERLGRSPMVPELAEATGLDAERVVDVLQARRLSRVEPVAEFPEAALAADDPALRSAESRAELGPRVERLDARQRAVVALRFGAGMSQREIAAQLGISQMHVSRLLRNALELLSA
jgi:RNA polymerase sigma factor (sigma-70 family)